FRQDRILTGVSSVYITSRLAASFSSAKSTGRTWSAPSSRHSNTTDSETGTLQLSCIRASRYQGKLAPYFAIASEALQVASYFSGVTPAGIGAMKRSSQAEHRRTSCS